MLIRRPDDLPSREITDQGLFWSRRSFLATVGGAALVAMPGERLEALARRFGDPEDKLTPWDAVTGYNNFYEFGTSKDDPARNAKDFKTAPLEREGRRRGGQACHVFLRRPPQGIQPGREGVPAPLCGRLVDGGAVERRPLR